MLKKPRDRSPGQKAQHTAKWARTMTKWLITFNRRTGAKWNVVEFGGKAKAESRGIVDLLAIRKDHRKDRTGLKRGDVFEMVLIQTKGGSARPPTLEDAKRLAKVARYHNARSIVLAEWRKGEKLNLFRLKGSTWIPAPPVEIFG
jgi:hypothetical protein